MAGKENVVVDLTNYKDKVGDRVPEGRYRVVVEDAEKDRSNAGNDMINVWLRIVGGEHDGSMIVDRLVLTEKSLFRVVGFMKALGLPTPKKRLQVNIGTWVGKVLFVDVHDGEPYNGKVKSEVRGYEKAPKRSASPAKADPGDTDFSGLDEFTRSESTGATRGEATPPEEAKERVENLLDAGPDGPGYGETGTDVPGDQRALAMEVPEEVNLDDLRL